MVDGFDLDGLTDSAAGVDVLIEPLEDQMFAATLRWTDSDRAGVEFAKPFDLERLQLSPATTRRRLISGGRRV